MSALHRENVSSTLQEEDEATGVAGAGSLLDRFGEHETFAERTPRRVPPTLSARYQNIQFLGEGAMATVYRALDPSLGRLVALKLLKGDDPDLWRRFRAEARAQARIVHENVCRVYEAGEADGEPYISMQYIDGLPLSAVAHQLSLERVVKLMIEVALALHEAHRTGMIHRDIKPANILIEKGEDDSQKPYVLDFGLVRNIGDGGQTQTGAIVGTPAFMAPEQALGKVREMDRRTDVYSLGATLYDVIAGKPPFESDHPWKLMMMIALEDAPALGKVKKGVPADIETIVMKCLEREPSRRYESARALAEDLQRFLDGEAIGARRSSLVYFLWKKAQKYKLATGFLAIALTGTLVPTCAWVRERRWAAEQTRLAHDLGEDVKEMTLFLRTAYELPLHDVENERAIVRRRLGKIQQRMIAAGRAGEGPGHYAIGQGYLALGEPDAAREHLEKAAASGYSSPELEYALGRTLGEIFRRELSNTKRLTNQAERKAKVAELERTLRDPAIAHLKGASGSTLDVPTFAEGLIALYQGQNDVAVEKARLSFEQAPWMYEAKKLEGDALFAEGSKYRHDAAFDYDKMNVYFEPAAEAYRMATEIGRSDPAVHQAECELWEKMGQAAGAKSLPFDAAFDKAEAASERAIKSSTKAGSALVQRALVLSARLYAMGSKVDERAKALVDKALRAAEDGVTASPNDVMAHYAAALARNLGAKVNSRLGRPTSTDGAVSAYGRVIAMDPRFVWAVNELGDVYLFEAEQAFVAGRDGQPFVDRAIQQYEQAMAVDPTFVLPAGGRLKAKTAQIEADIVRGRDAEGALVYLFDAIKHLEANGFGPWLVTFWKARANLLRGSFEFMRGRDPRPFVAAAEKEIVAFVGEARDDYWLLVELVRGRLLEAQQALRDGADAMPFLAEARELVAKALKSAGSTQPALSLLLARIDLSELRFAEKGGGATDPAFTAAFADIQVLLASPTVDAPRHHVAAQFYLLRAASQLKRGKDIHEDLAAGLALTKAALSKNPHYFAAFFTLGQIHLLRRRGLHNASEATAVEQLANSAFDSARKEGPLAVHDGLNL